MRPSQILVWWCSSFIVGIFFGPVMKISNSFLAVFVFLELLLIPLALIFKKEKIWLVYFSFLFLVLGVWRYSSAFEKLSRPDLQGFFAQIKGKEIWLEGIVIEDPEIEAAGTKFKLKVPDWQASVLVTTQLSPVKFRQTA